MFDKVTLEIGTTNIHINYKILDVSMQFYVKRVLDDFCRKRLTSFEYIKRLNRFVQDKQFFVHDNDNGEYIIPISYLLQLEDYFAINNILFDKKNIELYTPRQLSFSMSDTYSDRENQLPAIKHLSETPKSLSGLELQTGGGKTVVTIRSCVNMNMTTMIVVDGLVTQWYAEFKKHTKVDKNIYVIQEFKSIKTLLDSDLRPEIFICSLSTIRSYIKAEGNYADILPYKEFVKKYGIGIKVSDEAHLCFHATCMIDLAANIPHNIYLTATFENANTSVRRIFKTYFPDHFRFGGEDYEKYTNSFFYAYRGTVPEKRCSTPRGYNHSKYEEFLLKHPKLLVDWLDRILMPIVNMHYVNKKYINKKLLIFCATIEMAQTVVAFLKDRTEGYNVVSKVDDDSEDNFINGDIIVSTHKGSGTGRHIEGLMVVINTVSFQASTLSKQVMGRLRKPKDGSTPEYVDMFDTNINAHARHYNERGPIIKDCSLSYKEYRI